MNVYEMVTDRMIELLEAGTVPWHKPWKVDGRSVYPIRMNTGERYRGGNVFLLAMTALEEGYSSPYWGTYAEIAKRAGMVRQGKRWVSPDGESRGVRRGEKGTFVVYWDIVPRKPREHEDPEGKYTTALLRYYKVFNAEQADALPAKYYPAATEDAAEFSEIDSAECIVKGYFGRDGAPALRHGGDSAHYQAGPDLVTLPERESFDDSEAYYATAMHEMTHSTGHPGRLNRPGVADFDHFGSDRYGKEELVAEMGSAFLRALCGIEAHFDNSAAYLASWIKTIKGDPRLIVHAAAQAQKAADFITGESDG